MQVRVIEAGMASSLGLNAEMSCAAARAGMSRAATLQVLNADADAALAGSAVAGHCMAGGSAEGFVGLAKAQILGRAAMADLLARCAAHEGGHGATACYVALPDRRELDAVDADQDGADDEDDADDSAREALSRSAAWRRSSNNLARALTAYFGIEHSMSEAQVVHGSHEAFAVALHHAQAQMQAGRMRRCIVGAIDSMVEPSLLRAAAEAATLKTEDGAVGYMPGEGAAFVLLEAVDDGTPSGANGLVIASMTFAVEEAVPQASVPGRALARAIRPSVQACRESGLGECVVIADLNGGVGRATEWGHCQVHLDAGRALPQSALWLPAQSFGEAGTAAAAFAITMALQASRRGYLPPGGALVVLSAPSGRKAALWLHD